MASTTVMYPRLALAKREASAKFKHTRAGKWAPVPRFGRVFSSQHLTLALVTTRRAPCLLYAADARRRWWLARRLRPAAAFARQHTGTPPAAALQAPPSRAAEPAAAPAGPAHGCLTRRAWGPSPPIAGAGTALRGGQTTLRAAIRFHGVADSAAAQRRAAGEPSLETRRCENSI